MMAAPTGRLIWEGQILKTKGGKAFAWKGIPKEAWRDAACQKYKE